MRLSRRFQAFANTKPFRLSGEIRVSFQPVGDVGCLLSAGDKITGGTKYGALQCLISLRRAPVGFADGTAATPITGAPAAYCFDIHTPRASRTGRLSAPEHHRYVRVLDWKVSRESEKGGCVEERMACKCKQGKRSRNIFNCCERLTSYGRNEDGCGRVQNHFSQRSQSPAEKNENY